MNEIAEHSQEKTQRRGRPRAFDQDIVLDRAITVFCERGYHGTSIGDLADATGLTTGSLYKAFRDKRDILLAAFERYRKGRYDKLRAVIEGQTNGRDKVRAALQFYADAAHGAQGQRGCLVISMASELAMHDAAAAASVAMAHAVNEGLLRETILAGQADGSIGRHLDAAVVARAVFCLCQGMRILGKTGRQQEEMTSVAKAAIRLLD